MGVSVKDVLKRKYKKLKDDEIIDMLSTELKEEEREVLLELAKKRKIINDIPESTEEVEEIPYEKPDAKLVKKAVKIFDDFAENQETDLYGKAAEIIKDREISELSKHEVEAIIALKPATKRKKAPAKAKTEKPEKAEKSEKAAKSGKGKGKEKEKVEEPKAEEKVEKPEKTEKKEKAVSFKAFKDLAMKAENVNDFYEAVKEMKDVPKKTVDKFYKKYGQDGKLAEFEALKVFYDETMEKKEKAKTSSKRKPFVELDESAEVKGLKLGSKVSFKAHHLSKKAGEQIKGKVTRIIIANRDSKEYIKIETKNDGEFHKRANSVEIL